ncbi:MAG: hypothetical protein EBZ60_02105 [Betaproteobacteria bacterium]|nr:hypothetical protein [Betaproteobacteria bacterium]
MHQGFEVGGGIGHRIRQAAAVCRQFPRRPKAPKHRMDVRRKLGHVGHHHHDVSRLQVLVLIQPSQQQVVQYLDLALGRMRLGETQAVVSRTALHQAQRGACRRGLRVQDCRLQLLECSGVAAQRVGFFYRVYEGVDAVEPRGSGIGQLEPVNRMQIIAPVLAPGRQQRVPLGDSCIGQVSPMHLAGVVHEHQHGDEATQRDQGFQGLHGQGGDAEHQETFRHARQGLASRVL